MSESKTGFAGPEDNRDLIELFRKFPVKGSLSYILDRSPDYFSFCRLYGEGWKVIIAKKEEKLTGAITTIFDRVSLDGQIRKISYMSDLRVDTSERGTGLGDRLMQETYAVCRQELGENPAVFSCVIKENKAGLRKLELLSNTGLTSFKTVAELVTYFIIPFDTAFTGRLRKKYSVRQATAEDLPEMHRLWQAVNSRKNLARAFSAEEFSQWITETIGISSYLLAVEKGVIAGFSGVWQQSHIRQIVVTAETPVIKLIRKTWNLLRPVLGTAHFPRPGESLSFYNAVNLCVPAENPEVLTLLAAEAFRIVKDNNSLFLALALDKKDPLNQALKKFISSTSELFLLTNTELSDNKRLFHPEISLG